MTNLRQKKSERFQDNFWVDHNPFTDRVKAVCADLENPTFSCSDEWGNSVGSFTVTDSEETIENYLQNCVCSMFTMSIEQLKIRSFVFHINSSKKIDGVRQIIVDPDYVNKIRRIQRFLKKLKEIIIRRYNTKIEKEKEEQEEIDKIIKRN